MKKQIIIFVVTMLLSAVFASWLMAEIQGPASVAPGEYFELFTDSKQNVLWIPTSPAGLRYGEHDGVFCSAAPCHMAGKEISIFAVSAELVDDQIVQTVQTHTITVSGEAPPPPPPDDDDDTEHSQVWVIVVEESAERTPAQARVLVPLAPAVKAAGSFVRIVDDDDEAQWVQSWVAKAGDVRPFMFITSTESPAKILWKGSLPDTLDDVMARVNQIIKPKQVAGTIRRIN